MEHVPVFDQSGTSLCHSFVAAEMIDAWRFSHGDKDYNFITSPVGNQIRKEAKNWYSVVEPDPKTLGGDPCPMVNFIRKNGNCNEFDTLDSFNNTSVADSMDLMLEPFNALMKGASLQERINGLPEAKIQKATDDVRCLMHVYAAPAGLAPSAEAISTALRQQNSVKYLETVMLAKCQGDRVRPFNGPKCEHDVLSEWEPSELKVKKIHNLLAKKNPQPVAIKMCDKIFERGRNYRPPFGMAAYSSANCGSHLTLIIGQRKKNGRCEFKIRNSWGTGCGGYKDWECTDKGDLWIDSDSLAPSILDLNSFHE